MSDILALSARLAMSPWLSLKKDESDIRENEQGEIECLLAETLASLRDCALEKRSLSIQSNKSIPLVSVIVTTFNCRNLLPSSLASLLLQSHANIEIVVVDDCSTDGTFQLMQSIARIVPNIVSLQTEKNSGTYVAKNLGLLRAQGKFITFQDSDDISHASRIERQLSILSEQPELVATSCHYCRIDEYTGQLLLNRGERSRGGLISLMVDWPRVRDIVGFFDSVRVNADDEFKSRIRRCFGKKSVKEMDECLYFALMRHDGLTGSGHTANNIGATEMRKFLAPVRQRYTASFQEWHRSDTDRLYMEFPGVGRAFPAPISIDPFFSTRFSTNVLVVTSGLSKSIEVLIEKRANFISKFFSRILIITAEEAGEGELTGAEFFSDQSKKLALPLIHIDRQSTVDRTIKEIVDAAGGGAMFIIDSAYELDVADDNWLRFALYQMSSSSQTSKVILSGRSGAIYVPIDDVNISAIKFSSAIHNIKRAIAIEVLRNGAELVVQ